VSRFGEEEALEFEAGYWEKKEKKKSALVVEEIAKKEQRLNSRTR
jgi:hypothetical protein